MISLNGFTRIAIVAVALNFLPHIADAHEYRAGPLTILHPWTRATVNHAKVAGGYFTVKNEGAQPDRLVAISAEISDKSEVHEMMMKGEVMQMHPMDDGLAIPAHGEVTLQPGAGHVMFMGLKRQLKAGDSFKGTLTFEKAGTVPVEFKVEAMGSGASPHMNH